MPSSSTSFALALALAKCGAVQSRHLSNKALGHTAASAATAFQARSRQHQLQGQLQQLQQQQRSLASSSSSSSSSSVAVHKPSSAAAIAEQRSGAVAARRKQGVALRAENAAARVEEMSSKIFAGSSSGTAYYANTPVLGEHFGPNSKAAHVRPSSPKAPSARSPPSTFHAPAPVEPNRSLAELEQLPAKELKRLLAIRGVSLGSATEKAELAQWVHQHQDLPVKHRDATGSEITRRPLAEETKERSLQEWKECSVSELREELKKRGVGDCPGTEKLDLVEWVYQHQHLPALRPDDPRRGQEQRTWRRGFGPGRAGDPYDLPRDEQHKKKEQKQLEGEDVKQLEGEETKLLEGSSEADTEEEHKGYSKWFLIPVALVSGLAATILLLVYLDGQRSDTSDRPLKEPASQKKKDNKPDAE